VKEQANSLSDSSENLWAQCTQFCSAAAPYRPL